MVAEHRFAALGRGAHAGDVVENPLDLRAGEIGRRRQPGARRGSVCPCASESALTIRSVRVSCQTMALYQGRPVFGFQTMVVSRWLVTPIAARSAAVMLALRIAPAINSSVRAAISSGSCSTQPGCGRICWCSSWWRAISLPAAVEHHEARARRPLIDRADVTSCSLHCR